MTNSENLNDILENERSALLNAEYEKLEDILREKESYFDHAMADPLRLIEMQGASEKIKRNSALLDAALSGLRAAADVIAYNRSNRSTITVYDHVGSKTCLSTSSAQSFEKKA